jgi:hypothetical protein
MQSLVYDFAVIVNILNGIMLEKVTKVPGAAFYSENVTSEDSKTRISE